MTQISTELSSPRQAGAGGLWTITDVLIVLGIIAAFMATGGATGWLALGPAGTIVGAIVAWRLLKYRGESLADIGMGRPRRIWMTFILGVVATVGISAVVAPVSYFVGQTLGAPDTSFFNSMEGNVPFFLVMLLTSWTAAAFGEEIVFRGFVLRRIAQAGGMTTAAWIGAVLLQGAIFGLGHSYQGLAGVIITGTVGIAAASAFLLTKRNLWTVIIAHGLIDTIAFVAFFSGAIQNTGDGATHTSALIGL